MERYSGIQALEAMPESGATWIMPGGETGLEEPMCQLGLGREPGSYPERLNEPDCIYYLRTGFCGYGDRCRFNHPRYHRGEIGDFQARRGEYPERAGQPACQYYLRTGDCRFGASCKYNHPKTGVGSSVPIKLNSQGYPLRPGAKECSYYVNTGRCKFGVTCKFNHPQTSEIQVTTETRGLGHVSTHTRMLTPVYPTFQSPSVQYSLQYGPTPGNWPVARPAVLPGHYVPGSHGPMILHPGVIPFPGWTPYQTPVATVEASSSLLSSSATAYAVPFFSATSSASSLSSDKKEHGLPGRPSQQVCQHYLKTGGCKFGLTCKYHHPPTWNMTPESSVTLSPLGLPLRIGAPLCLHYARNRVCKFGYSCRFDHPMELLSYSPSASSLTDVSVAPHPMGSMSATLAPSSSSSDLRPQLLSDSSKSTFSSSMSSMSSSSASLGSTFSKTGPDPESSIQQTGLDSDNATGGSS